MHGLAWVTLKAAFFFLSLSFSLQQGWGYDFRRGLNVSWDDYGKYSTDLYTDEAVALINQHKADKPLFLYLAHQAVHSANTYSPLQAPSEVVDRFKDSILDPDRRKFAGMLTKLDDSIGHVVQALQVREYNAFVFPSLIQLLTSLTCYSFMFV